MESTVHLTVADRLRLARLKTFGAGRYRLFVRYKAQLNRPKGVNFDVITIGADEMLTDDDLANLKDSSDRHSVVYDTKTKKWHIPTVGWRGNAYHEKYIDKLLPDESKDRDATTVRGWWIPSSNTMELYSTLEGKNDWDTNDSHKLAAERAFKMAEKNMLMAGGKIVNARRITSS